ncbi:phage tail protein [Lacticaseibacillus mingshuiensis]|uniref:Phage tail protein n=1 Tax=Lacticaseibacillus mingshuiensis TaxID=2799574 RepID=A0ABW4CGL1_9LACO|nr:phage tail protein [Lacticaseibacillus mingshuiensis]
MALVGLNMVSFALIDPTTQQILKGDEGLSADGIYKVDTKDLGSKTANITGLTGSSTKRYGNNVAQMVTYGAAAPQIAWDGLNLDFDTKQKIKGFTPDSKGGWLPADEPAHIAVLIESGSLSGGSIYFGFGNATAVESEANVQTNDDNKQIVDDALTISALDTIAFGHKPFKLYNSADTGFDEPTMLKEVFGGYVAGTGTGTSTGTGD